MNVQHTPTALTGRHEHHSYARLPGRWRLLARSLWIILVVGALGVSLARLPLYLAQLRTPCAGLDCSYQQLTPEQVRALAGFSLSTGDYAAYILMITFANVAVCLAVSAVIALRRPDDRMAFIVALMLVTLGPQIMSESMSTSPSSWGTPNQYLGNLCTALLLLVFSLFPTGRFEPHWMRWPMVVLFIGAILTPPTTLKIGVVGLGFVVFLVEVSLLVVAQLYRYRRVSTPLQQQQTKWVVVGFAALTTTWVIAIALYLIFPALAAPDSLYFPAFTVVQGVQLLMIPITFGVAMLRYQLWDIDTLVNRALVYGSLTAILTAVFAGLVIGLQALLSNLLGGTGLIIQGSGGVIALSTLAIVILIRPLSRHMQALIDRRFYRRKYDAAKTLEAFSATLRYEADMDALREQVLAVVEETMQPEHASLWLRSSHSSSQRESGGDSADG